MDEKMARLWLRQTEYDIYVVCFVTDIPKQLTRTYIYLYNSYWYGGQYQDIQTSQVSWYRSVEILSPEPGVNKALQTDKWTIFNVL